MKRLIKFYSISVMALLIMGCDDILETDISNDTVEVLSPLNGSIESQNNVLFQWKTLEGSDEYRIQIFNENQVLTRDTTSSVSSHLANLNPGDYSWRIKGLNFAYQTEFSIPINFTVDPDEDLTNQNVVLVIPENETYSNLDINQFDWLDLSSADSYSMELVKISDNDEIIYQNNAINTSNLSIEDDLNLGEGVYKWMVKAQNSFSETEFTSRTFFIDLTPPNTPILTSPGDQETVTSSVIFEWDMGVDIGLIQSPIKYKIEISSEVNFETLLYTEELDDVQFDYIFNNTGVIYWRVKAIDKAENQSDYSQTFSFLIP